MVTTVIIDDEKNALDVIAIQLKNYCPDVKVLTLCQGGEEGINAIKDLKPDLVFLDIEMPKVNGFDVLERTKDQKYNVIFTTAYDQFAIKAFKYSAVDYLLKPIDIEELKSAVDKVKKSPDDDFRKKVEVLLNHLDLSSASPKKIALPVGDGYEMVAHTNIVRCESDSNYTTIYLSDKRKITLSKTLKEVEGILSHSSFYRVHHSHLINMDHISKFYKTDGGYILMSDGAQINISRNKKDAFFEYLHQN
jgi:two-component system LytT family response regulator